jgi:hypothetical protein
VRVSVCACRCVGWSGVELEKVSVKVAVVTSEVEWSREEEGREGDRPI